MLYPKFKLGFIPQEEHMQCRQLMLLYIQRVQRELHPPVVVSGSSTFLGDCNVGEADDKDEYGFLLSLSHQKVPCQIR